jgi:hypothetical protein
MVTVTKSCIKFLRPPQKLVKSSESCAASVGRCSSLDAPNTVLRLMLPGKQHCPPLQPPPPAAPRPWTRQPSPGLGPATPCTGRKPGHEYPEVHEYPDGDHLACQAESKPIAPLHALNQIGFLSLLLALTPPIPRPSTWSSTAWKERAGARSGTPPHCSPPGRWRGSPSQ